MALFRCSYVWIGGFFRSLLVYSSNYHRWNKDLFVSQAATMTELTGVLMNTGLEDIRPSVTEDSFESCHERDEEDQLDAGKTNRLITK